MRKFLVFVALCAVCSAAPAPADITEAPLARPSPINPDVVSDPKPDDKVVLLAEPKHRQKRHHSPDHQGEEEKPHSHQEVKSAGAAGHDEHAHDAHSHEGHEAAHHDLKQVKRESPEKSTCADGHDAHAHDAHDHEGHEASHHDLKQVKRESHEKPAGADGHDAHAHDAHGQDAHGHDAHSLAAPLKPHTLEGHEAAHHDLKHVKRESPAKPDSVDGHDAHAHDAHGHDAHSHAATIKPHTLEAAHHDSKKVKRDSPAKPASVDGHDAHAHDAHGHDAHSHADTIKPHTLEAVHHDSKKVKRESPSKPASVDGHDAHAHDAHGHDAHGHDAHSHADTIKPHTLEAVHHDSKKVKRESPAKPASVAGHEAVKQNAHSLEERVEHPEPLIPQAEKHDLHKIALERHQRDIPVPTQIKSTTAAPKVEEEKPQVEDLHVHVPHTDEDSHTTPHGPLRHHPVPVAELFNQHKSTPKAGSSEESKESKESHETNA